MTPHQTLAAAIRLFAIWLFLHYVASTVDTYVQLRKYSPDDILIPLIAAFVVILIFCGFLWKFPIFLAKKILPYPDSIEYNQTKLFDDWYSVGCSLIGLWVLEKAIPTVAFYIIGDYVRQQSHPENYIQNADWKLMVYFNIFQVVLGFWLFFGGDGLKKILMWARRA